MTSFTEKYGPWALIAGASEGTGAEFARQLAAKGLNLILVARREGPLDALAAEIGAAHGVQCITATVDLTKKDAATRMADITGEREVGLLIANAGADTNGSQFLDTDIAQWDALVAMNVTTTMRLVHHFGQAMRARERGGMILVGSGACYGGLNGLAVYCASKAFVMDLAEGLWAELRHYGIDVLNLILGRTDTPAHRKSLAQSGQPVSTVGVASPVDVARVGLEQLPHGPIYNWGSPNDQPGFAPQSPDARRARIIAVEQATRAYSGKP
ncbi:MAG: SDR family NAD(P)-dependent oxidoreductase [Novosphingobium sp.]